MKRTIKLRKRERYGDLVWLDPQGRVFACHDLTSQLFDIGDATTLWATFKDTKTRADEGFVHELRFDQHEGNTTVAGLENGSYYPLDNVVRSFPDERCVVYVEVPT